MQRKFTGEFFVNLFRWERRFSLFMKNLNRNYHMEF